MKKLLAIALAFVMLFALTVTVAAEEVILSEDTLFFSASNWTQYDAETTTADFAAALATPGAYLVITRSAPTDITSYDLGYEKFCITDSWWAGRIANDAGEEINVVRLGTGAHTIEAATTQSNSPYDVSLDCVLDDGTKVWYDAAEFLAIWTAAGFDLGGPNLVVISNTSSTAYDIVNFSIVVPDAPIAAPEEAPAEEEAPVEEEAPATEEEAPAEEESEPADTGLALAVVPMLVAAAAVVISKRR